MATHSTSWSIGAVTGPSLTRRDFVLAAAGALALPPLLLEALARADPGAPRALPAATGSGWTEADYWAFADRHQALFELSWSEDRRHYSAGGAGETSMNANLLYVHAAAAHNHHDGLARNDHRARVLAQRLCEDPPWRPAPGGRERFVPPPDGIMALDQSHAYGWGAVMEGHGGQHVVVDTAVVRGLAMAYAARNELDLPERTALAIQDRIRRCAYSQFYTFPALRLNQINWPVEIYTHAADVLGDPHLLRQDTRLQLSRFATAAVRRVPPWSIPLLGAGYRFHYLPQFSELCKTNFDSAEYANIVCGVVMFYERARRSGMRELSPGQLRVMRAWVERVLCGYWTHGGYLNWDTGMGFLRWHQGKKLALCQHALLAIATADRFQRTPNHGRWAKYFFDRGLELFDRLVREAHGLPRAVMFGVTRTPGGIEDSFLFSARMCSNAAQAVELGLQERRSEEPPPLYSFDPDTGRLAITTPRYNTAILPVNGGAIPYGGMELARFFDSDQRVAANIGGRPPASFGVIVRNEATGRQTASQLGRPHPSLVHRPLRLSHAPAGNGARPRPYPSHAYAGPFSRIDATGVTVGPTVAIRSSHRFRRNSVESRWRIRVRGRTRAPHTVHVLFPSWGAAAQVTAVLHDGRRLPLRNGKIALTRVAWFHLAGPESGYVVVPVRRSPGARAHLLHPRAQSSDPHPGPTLALELLTGRRLRPLEVAVRVAPAASAGDADRVARELRGG